MALVKTMVRVWTLKTAKAEPEQILTLIKAHIPKAVAVKVMHSGNIKVTLPNQQAKD